MIFTQRITRHFGKVPKMEESGILFLAVWMLGLCKGIPIPKTAGYKVQETLHFRYLKFLVKESSRPWCVFTIEIDMLRCRDSC